MEEITDVSGPDKNNLAPQVGFEPTTLRLTAECSTIELLRSKVGTPYLNRARGRVSNRTARAGGRFCSRARSQFPAVAQEQFHAAHLLAAQLENDVRGQIPPH